MLLKYTNCIYIYLLCFTLILGFSRQIVELLNQHGAKYSHFDILTDNDVRQGWVCCYTYMLGLSKKNSQHSNWLRPVLVRKNFCHTDHFSGKAQSKPHIRNYLLTWLVRGYYFPLVEILIGEMLLRVSLFRYM